MSISGSKVFDLVDVLSFVCPSISISEAAFGRSKETSDWPRAARRVFAIGLDS